VLDLLRWKFVLRLVKKLKQKFPSRQQSVGSKTATMRVNIDVIIANGE